jgi:hypothetical protein
LSTHNDIPCRGATSQQIDIVAGYYVCSIRIHKKEVQLAKRKVWLTVRHPSSHREQIFQIGKESMKLQTIVRRVALVNICWLILATRPSLAAASAAATYNLTLRLSPSTITGSRASTLWITVDASEELKNARVELSLPAGFASRNVQILDSTPAAG